MDGGIKPEFPQQQQQRSYTVQTHYIPEPTGHATEKRLKDSAWSV